MEKGIRMAKKKLFLLAAAEINKRMVETFSKYHTHPYDVQATIVNNENGFDVILMFPSDISQIMTKSFSFEQVAHPDEEVNGFFEEAAEKCKSFWVE